MSLETETFQISLLVDMINIGISTKPTRVQVEKNEIPVIKGLVSNYTVFLRPQNLCRFMKY